VVVDIFPAVGSRGAEGADGSGRSCSNASAAIRCNQQMCNVLVVQLVYATICQTHSDEPQTTKRQPRVAAADENEEWKKEGTGMAVSRRQSVQMLDCRDLSEALLSATLATRLTQLTCNHTILNIGTYLGRVWGHHRPLGYARRS
jgi:hypothetical protein